MYNCIIACLITKFVKSERMHVCIFFVCLYVLYMRGGLSLYSHSQNQPTLSILNEEPINEDIEFKTLDGKRSQLNNGHVMLVNNLICFYILLIIIFHNITKQYFKQTISIE